MSTLLDMPNDILLLIICNFLDAPEVLLLRRTCREISQLTRDKIVWLRFLERLQNSGEIPLPNSPDTDASLENIVISAYRASQLWLKPRQLGKPILNPLGGRPIKGLNIYLDVWLLIVYADGFVYLWNIQKDAGHICGTLDLRTDGFRWTSYSASLDPTNEAIILAIQSIGAMECETRLYSIKLGIDQIFTLIRTFKHPLPRGILVLDTARKLVVLASSTQTLDVIKWDSEEHNMFVPLDDFDDDAEETLFNTVIALRLLGSHFLAIRTHTIELHLCDDSFQPQRGTKPLKHVLPFPLQDGAASLSDAVLSAEGRIHVNLLAYDAHSLACYNITIALPTTMAASMEVTLIGKAPLHILCRTPSFVSAHALGAQGIRAMWVERNNHTMTRRVRVFAFNRHKAWHEMDEAFDAFSLKSYDLREDLTHCALAELSGNIALANRSGHVFLLPAE
ncbi:hypothetical protein R3P38DRAFT_2620039 [Favolaschia claudopus]|uniref:F-box domain-containing protein n=1 Tax=Favolaschia claudopus TaxID=2862362 RepID=A0AAW0BWX3_9AGAR